MGRPEIDYRERENLRAELHRIQLTLSPRITSRCKCTVVPKWRRVRTRDGRDVQLLMHHVFEVDKTHDPSRRRPPKWLAAFPFVQEAESFAAGFEVGRSQFWTGNLGGIAGSAIAYRLRAPGEHLPKPEEPKIILDGVSDRDVAPRPRLELIHGGRAA